MTSRCADPRSDSETAGAPTSRLTAEAGQARRVIDSHPRATAPACIGSALAPATVGPAHGRAAPGRGGRVLFWLWFAVETLSTCRLSRLARLRLGRRPALLVAGAEHIPAGSAFVLAVNHFRGRPVLDVVAAVVLAAGRARPDLADRHLLIVGKRASPGASTRRPIQRLATAGLNLVYRRWSGTVLRIPLGNDRVSIAQLREWRQRAVRQPSLVFPEGKARLSFGRVRPGAARWLASVGVPVLPVGVWWRDGAWQVRFGAPLVWSRRPELRDRQLGLAIAALLPAEFARVWQPQLDHWRSAHLPATKSGHGAQVDFAHTLTYHIG